MNHTEIARSLVKAWEDRERHWLDGGIHKHARDALVSDIAAALQDLAAPQDEASGEEIQGDVARRQGRRR